jgi:thiamine-monophosphate kinase
VAGGNLTKSPGPRVIDITVVGTAKRRQVLTRAGARPGDAIYVSGTLEAIS